MAVLKATTSVIAGIVAGLAVGYALWGEPMAIVQETLTRVSTELTTTKGWLWDEIHTSDERYARLSSRLERALADLATARAELARLRTASRARSDAPTPRPVLPASASRGAEAGAGSDPPDSRQPATATEGHASRSDPWSR